MSVKPPAVRVEEFLQISWLPLTTFTAINTSSNQTTHTKDFKLGNNACICWRNAHLLLHSLAGIMQTVREALRSDRLKLHLCDPRIHFSPSALFIFGFWQLEGLVFSHHLPDSDKFIHCLESVIVSSTRFSVQLIVCDAFTYTICLSLYLQESQSCADFLA